MMVVLMGIGTAFAQISTGEPNASVLPRTGNRPQAGDFGMYAGVSVSQIMDLATLNKKLTDESVQTYWALPMINLKYYITDRWEFRCGFEFAARSTTTNHVETTSEKKDFGAKNYTNSNFTRFLPGAAYHFATNNILDVYVGAQMPIGFNVNEQKASSFNTESKKYSAAWHQGEFVIGGGVFLGMQFFVADLPFAIGIEGGYSGQAVLGNDKGVTKITDMDGNKYTLEGNQIGAMPTKEDDQLKKSTFMEANWHADAALTFTYYFRK